MVAGLRRVWFAPCPPGPAARILTVGKYRARGDAMAKRRRPQPRDGRGRFTKVGFPVWLAVLVAVVLVVYAVGK